MADSAAFEAACDALEQRSALDRLAARGTIRLVLKEAGLEAKIVTRSELAVAVQRLLPAALSARGVAEPEMLCTALQKAHERVEHRSADDTPDAIFARLAR
jgi:hypothetical protein